MVSVVQVRSDVLVLGVDSYWLVGVHVASIAHTRLLLMVGAADWYSFSLHNLWALHLFWLVWSWYLSARQTLHVRVPADIETIMPIGQTTLHESWPISS